MKRRFNRAISFLLAFIMTASMVSFDAFAEPAVDAAAQAEEIAAEAEEAVEADSSESTTEAKSEEATTKEASSKSTKKAVKKANSEEKDAKEAIQDGIFKDRDQTTVDLSDYNLSKKEAKSLTNDVLEDSNADTLVTTTYETDDDGNVTTMEVEMDPELELAYDQLDAANENADDSDNEYTIEDVYKAYAEYQKFIDSNPKYFGLTVPYNTQKDAVGTINSMLTLASINPDYVKAGVVPADDLMGMVQLFHQGNQMAVQNMGEDLLKAKDEALKCLDDDMSDVEKLLALNDWLADYCTFDMAYLMDMDAPSQKGHVPTEDEQMQETIAGVWKGNQFGALVERNSVCMGYTAAYAYLVQWAFPEIYAQLDENGNVKKDENGDIVWKSKNEVNYVLDEEGNVKKDEDGTPILNENGYMVDYVRITFDADVTMFGEEQEKFDSDHYWNAVKVNGKWYYVDSAYTDIYIECMSRDRVETDGNMNHLYFMFSDDTTRDLYKKDDDTNFYSNIDTLYKGVATDKTYEDAWFAFAKSPVHEEEDKWYYFYDSTDVIDNMNNYGGMGQGTNSASASKASSNKKAENDYGDIMGQDTEYKLVYHDGSKADSDDSFETLVDFNNGQVYNPETKAMEDNALIKELYAEHEKYVERYPSVAISGDVYDGKFYFNIANCICSYDLNTGKVEKLMEYNDVYANRDLDVALGGMAFTVSDSGTHHVKNNPIASMTIKNGKMYVSIATNFGWISGKSSMYDDSSDGYEFEETNFTKGYNSYFNYNNETNDNDEFMWSANFVDTLDMSHVAGDSHTYAATTVSADCTHDGFTEERCSECGMIKADSRTVSEEDKALGHHYSKMNETYYTKDEDTGEFNTGTTYVCIYCKDAQDSIPEGEESCTYGNPKFEWSKNHKKCTATLTCQDSDHQAAKDVLDCAQPLVETATGDAITSDKSGAESCGTDTTITYTAKFSTNGKDYEATDTKTIEAAKGHEYGDPVFTWSKVMEEQDDGQGGTTEVQTGWKCDKVTITCNVCDHEETASGDAVTTTEETTTEATCTADGEKVFTATATLNGQTYTDTKSFTVASPGHQYDFQNPTFKWADDYSSCKGTLTCAVCKKKKMHYNCAVSDNKADIDYDCEKGATITHTATFYVMANPISGTKDEVIEPKSHAYDQEKNPVQFTWADDASSCKALYTCSDCGKTTDVDAKVEKDTEKSVAPTCTEKGKDVFKATASVEGVEGSKATSEKEIEVAAKGHSYDLEKDPKFTWAEDNKSAKATFVCTTCGKEEVKDCEVTEESKDATCTEAGTVTYTATVNFQNKDFTATKTVDEKPLGHNYGKPEFSWTKDEDGNYDVYADFACSRCDDTQHEKCDVTSKTTDATCTEKGETVYTATCEFNGETYTDTKTEEIPAKGHSYDLEKDPKFTWAEDNKSAKATFVCTTCGKEEVKDCEVTEESKDATCTEAGTVTYTATVNFQNKDFTATKTVDEKPLGHDYGKPEFSWTKDEDGNYDVYADFACSRCDDTQHEKCDVTSKTTDATCTEKGETVYTATCEFNGETYTDTKTEEIPAKGHSYDLEKDPKFTWAEDNKSAKATFVCTTCGKEEVKDCEVTEESKDATCTEAGTVTYTATVNFQNKDFTATKTVDEKPLGHDYGKPEFSWTKDEDGNYDVYADFACSRCDDTQHEKCDVTSKTTDATCTEKGETVYTATCEFNGETYTDTKTEEIPAKGHSYDLEKDPEFTWAEDNKSATATFVCTTCGKEEVKDCEVTEESKDATCTEAGTVTYTATVNFQNKDFTATKTVDEKPLGHNYGKPEFSWTKDEDGNYDVYADFACSRCDDTQHEKCDVTSKTTDATCTEKGETVYTATCEFNGETYTDTKTEEIPAKGHSYDLEKAPTFTWAEDNKSAKATFVCTVCGEEKVEDCKVTSKTTDATCTEDGETVYTATASFEGKDFTDKKTETIKAKGHSYGEPEFEWATADDGSTVAHAKFTCTVCKKDVVDKECTVTHKTTKEPTYVESGVETYTATCEFNGETYTGTRKVEIPKLDAEANMSKTSVTVYATAKSSVLTLSSKYEDDKIVSYKTASTTYASTSRSGNGLVITGKKAGKTSVTVKTASNETIKINVTVKTPSVKLTATKAPLQVKKSTTAIKVSSKISTDAISSVSSSSTSRVKAYRVKTSSGNYSTTGIKLVAQSKTGTATITVKMKSGAKATCKVTVQKSAVKVTSVSVPSTSVTLRLAGANKKTTYKIAAKRYPVTAASKIYYSTSNKKVATVSSSGTITAKKAGKATITVKSGTKTKKITVTVKSN